MKKILVVYGLAFAFLAAGLVTLKVSPESALVPVFSLAGGILALAAIFATFNELAKFIAEYRLRMQGNHCNGNC